MKSFIILVLMTILSLSIQTETATTIGTELRSTTKWWGPYGIWGYNNYWLNNEFSFFPYGYYGYDRAFYRPYGWGYLSSPYCAIGGYFNQLCMMNAYSFPLRDIWRPYYSCFRGLECAYRYGRCGWVGTPSFYNCWNGYYGLY